MAFNIKEILYPSDADQIKWEKVNYNFDQILSSGGKEGPKGEKGSSGITGNTGTKGEKGDTGSQGVKGDTGSSATIWEQFSHSTLSAYVLKPKDGTTTVEPMLVLGDEGYEEGTTDGYLGPDAQLTVETGTNVSYALKLGPADRINTPTLSYLAFTGQTDTVEGSAGTRWTIRPHTTGTNTKILINPDVIDLTADDKLYLSSSNGINFSGSGSTTIGTVLIANSTSTFNDDVTIDADISTINGGELTISGNAYINSTGGVKISVGTTAQRPNVVLSGTIRYNASVQKYEGYSNGNWLDFNRLSNPAKTTFVSVQQDSDYTDSVNDKIVLRAGGATRVIVNDSTYNDGAGTVSNAVLFAGSQVITGGDIHINDISSSSGKGIVFKEGEDYTSQSGSRAANNGMSRAHRSLNDHLAISFEISNDTSVATPLKTINNGATSGTVTPVTGYTASSTFYVQYVKVGWNVAVNGNFTIHQDSNWPFTSAGQQLFIDLKGSDYRFPYVNSSSYPIMVDVRIMDGSLNPVSTEFGEDLGLSVYGIIPSGQGRIYLWMNRQVWNGNEIDFTKVALEARHLLERDSNAVELMFNFNMPANWSSAYANDPSGLPTTTF